MVALFLDDNKTNEDHDGKENGKKYYDMKLPNFTSPLYGLWAPGEQSTKNCRFLFLNLDNDRYGPKENFPKICQIK